MQWFLASWAQTTKSCCYNMQQCWVWEDGGWNCLNETFYSSSKQPRFYVIICQIDFLGNSFVNFICTLTKKILIIINFVLMGLDSWLLCEAIRLWRVSVPHGKGVTGVPKCPIRVVWGASPHRQAFHSFSGVLWLGRGTLWLIIRIFTDT